MPKVPPITLLLLLCAAPACSSTAASGGQTGEESGGCHPVEQGELARDEVTPIGVVPNDLFDLVSEPYAARLWWFDQDLMIDDGTSTKAHLEFTAGNRPARYVREVDVRNPDSAHGCGGRAYVILGGELQFRTEDGSFDEVSSVTLQMEQAGLARTFVEIPWNKLSGSYDFDRLVPEGYTATAAGHASISFQASEARRVAEGTIRGVVETSRGVGTTSLQVGTLRDDPDASACSGGVDRASAGQKCDFVAKGLCFSSSEGACTCAGCEAGKCMTLESYPAQIRCQ